MIPKGYQCKYCGKKIRREPNVEFCFGCYVKGLEKLEQNQTEAKNE